MKLFIINGENNDEKLEIHINEYLMVRDIKYKLDEILHGNGNFTRFYFKLIHKNIILLDENAIKSYKICENDEIWFGKIDNYLREDDVIVDVFYKGHNLGGIHLIVKMNDTISTIKSIMEMISSKIIDIWNTGGKQMKNDQIVTEIDTNENYELIIRCDDGKGNEIDDTFVQLCIWHARYYVDQYLFWDQIRDDNKNESIRTILINRLDKIRNILSLNDEIDDRLNQNLADLPLSFINSTNLFSRDMADRIVYVCNNYWRFVINQYEYDTAMIFGQYYPFAIVDALWNYSNYRQNAIKTNKSIRSIIIDALDYFMKYLNDSSNDWQYWLRLFMNQYLMISYSDSSVNERIDKCRINKFTMKMKMNRKLFNNFLPYKPETIFKAKQSISKTFNVDMKHLYCIKPGADHEPNDEDAFDDEFIIEMLLSMDDIKILGKIGHGGFGNVYLCADKISNKQFLLKKSIKNDRDLHRDINIYSKLDSSNNIMNYSGLFRDEEGLCICMEYMSGGSLKSYLNKQKYLSEQEIVKISHEILTQINELHKLGIIHRDINSDNIVLDEHNHAKLIDFGLSKYTIGLTNKELVDRLKAYAPGRKCYMAPELINGEPYSEKIDIWSFGMVMAEMVTGEEPFHKFKDFQVNDAITSFTKYEFESNCSISDELNQIIDSCLNTNQDERPNAEELIASLLILL